MARQMLAELADLKVKLALIRAACSLITAGQSRASASEITKRAEAEFGVTVLPSAAGVLFSGLGVRSVASRGRSRLALDELDLEGIVTDIETGISQLETQAQDVLSGLSDQALRIRALEGMLEKYQELRQREAGLRRQLTDFFDAASRVRDLEDRMSTLQQEAGVSGQIERESDEEDG